MRPHHPWYRSATNSWYVEISGQTHLLGKHPEDLTQPRKRKKGQSPPVPPGPIEQAFHRLMASAPGNIPKANNLRVVVVCDLFLDFSEKHHTSDTYSGYKVFLQDFSDLYGTLLANDLKPLHVSRWLDTHPGWKGCRRNAIVAVKRAFNWADTEGILSPSPLKNVKKPPQRHRDRVLTPDERQAILAEIRDDHFRNFVYALLETGARPGEVRKVTAKEVNLDLGVWVFQEHKTAKSTGKPRIIYLTPAMLELTRKLVEQYPTGPLFRGPWSKGGYSRNSIRCRFRQLRRKLPQLVGVMSYTMRHSFATQALVNGVGLAHVAELLGHTNTDMVVKHYSHIAGNIAHMRDAALKAVNGG